LLNCFPALPAAAAPEPSNDDDDTLLMAEISRNLQLPDDLPDSFFVTGDHSNLNSMFNPELHAYVLQFHLDSKLHAA
jgi:hypothetical protein